LKPNELNDWLGVITNLGVIAGLILVAYEIQQNNAILEQDARNARIEVTDGLRAAWQNYEFAIIENPDISDIWMRGNAGDPLDRLEQFRYEQLARERYRLTSQNYSQNSLIDGAPADWAVWQLARTASGNPRLTQVYMEQLARPGLRPRSENFPTFRNRVKELDPPEFRLPKSDN
jgi:hypothetical protein